MGLFGSNKQEKLKELQEKVIELGVDALTSLEFSSEERKSIILNADKSINEHFPDPRNAKKKLVRNACEKIVNDYPAFADRAGWIKDSAIEGIDEDGFIGVDSFDVLMSVIRWDMMTPDDAEKLLKNIRAEKGVLSTDDYKKIMAKIGQKYEAELLLELETVAPENIMRWIDATKRTGKAINNKVYEAAMAVKNK